MIVNNHGYIVIIVMQHTTQNVKMEKKESSSLHKMCASLGYSFRKQAIEDDVSFNFYLHRCPSVHGTVIY